MLQRLSFRAKLLAAQVALIGLVVGLVMFGLERTLARDLRTRAIERLEVQAVGAVEWAQRARHPQQVAERLAAVVGARVTLVDGGGERLADSDPTAASEDVRAQPE